MDHLLLRAPTVGSLVKKILSVNPDLGVDEIIKMVKQSIQTVGDSHETIDEEQALALARESLNKKSH